MGGLKPQKPKHRPAACVLVFWGLFFWEFLRGLKNLLKTPKTPNTDLRPVFFFGFWGFFGVFSRADRPAFSRPGRRSLEVVFYFKSFKFKTFKIKHNLHQPSLKVRLAGNGAVSDTAVSTQALGLYFDTS